MSDMRLLSVGPMLEFWDPKIKVCKVDIKCCSKTFVEDPLVVHASPQEGGSGLEGLTSGNGPPSVPERLCPGPLKQLRPVHGPWVPPQRRLAVSLQLPRSAPEVPSTPSAAAYPRV